MDDSPLWRQFRRLLLGAVVESLLAEGIAVEFSSLEIRFADTSAFRVPRFDNYMRFTGDVRGRLIGVPDAAVLAALARRLGGIWPELLSIIELPIGDTLTSERKHLEVRVEGGLLVVQFDLAAD